ncbi:hypothetical protein SGPA1_10222 [Streptomyces misionensis JCM 4497]
MVEGAGVAQTGAHDAVDVHPQPGVTGAVGRHPVADAVQDESHAGAAAQCRYGRQGIHQLGQFAQRKVGGQPREAGHRAASRAPVGGAERLARGQAGAAPEQGQFGRGQRVVPALHPARREPAQAVGTVVRAHHADHRAPAPHERTRHALPGGAARFAVAGRHRDRQLQGAFTAVGQHGDRAGDMAGVPVPAGHAVPGVLPQLEPGKPQGAEGEDHVRVGHGGVPGRLDGAPAVRYGRDLQQRHIGGRGAQHHPGVGAPLPRQVRVEPDPHRRLPARHDVRGRQHPAVPDPVPGPAPPRRTALPRHQDLRDPRGLQPLFPRRPHPRPLPLAPRPYATPPRSRKRHRPGSSRTRTLTGPRSPGRPAPGGESRPPHASPRQCRPDP